MTQPFLPFPPTGSKLETAFWAFHRANPHVYALLVELARQWRRVHGDGFLGIALLTERARWEHALRTSDPLGFKLNNNHRAYYSRLIMAQEPDLADVFLLRKQKIQSSIGPNNETLPSGEHVS